PTGFKIWGRKPPTYRDRDVRVGDFKEFIAPFDAEQANAQGGRCMDCGVPFCMQGCPLGNQIPDWNDLVYRDQWQRAYVALRSTNNFPEFTGRLCPAPCEGACVLAINDDPVTIEMIEKEIIEKAFVEGWVTEARPRARSGKTVAIVGSGPAGLAAAAQLNTAGHTVTVYEKADKLGGLLRYGIPDFKMEKWVIDRRTALMAAAGVQFETGVHVGETVSWSELKLRHDALVVAVGAEQARNLDVPGRDLDGVHMAMDFLVQNNQAVQRQLESPGAPADDADTPADQILATDKRVVILGGGDTGSDCLGTSLRQGASSVLQLELMPAPPSERAAENPWPQWPMVFRTSSSQSEGGERAFSRLTKRLVGKGGKLVALQTVDIRVEQDPSGRSSWTELPGTELTTPCELLILAMGFVSPVAADLAESLGVTLDGRGNVSVDENYQTSIPGVFAAGDAKRGASLIVWAIAEGREAARGVDTFLSQTPSRLPSRGINQPFGGR
ncbi:MAG: glutamate synthase (NADPH/NADH) small chain, partial [Myxococcota bacterium]